MEGTVLSSFVLGKTVRVRGACVVVVWGPCLIGSFRKRVGQSPRSKSIGSAEGIFKRMRRFSRAGHHYRGNATLPICAVAASLVIDNPN
jgi:hypothetical protein